MATTQREREIVDALIDKHEPAIRALYEILNQSHDGFEPIAGGPQPVSSIKIKIGETSFDEPSVPRLYRKVLVFLHDQGYLDRLELPVATSTVRYLLAREPKHQRGNNFVKQVEHENYYMEANKGREEAIKDLVRLLEQCGLSLETVG